MVTILSSASGRLVLEPDENDWRQVALDIDGRRRALGADVRSTIVERLLHALRGEPAGPTAGVLDGVSVRWVLSLDQLGEVSSRLRHPTPRSRPRSRVARCGLETALRSTELPYRSLLRRKKGQLRELAIDKARDKPNALYLTCAHPILLCLPQA